MPELFIYRDNDSLIDRILVFQANNSQDIGRAAKHTLTHVRAHEFGNNTTKITLMEACFSTGTPPAPVWEGPRIVGSVAKDRSHSGVRLLITLASVVVVIAGLKAAGSFLIPIIFALFLSLLCIPPMRRLQRHGLPASISIAVVVFVATILVLLITLVISGSIDQFYESLPSYQARLDAIIEPAVEWFANRGVDIDPTNIAARIHTGALMELVGETTRGVLSALSNIFIVILTMIFMLFEASGFAAKLVLARGANMSELSQITERVNKYLGIKAWISAGTGISVSILTALFGVDFPLLWGLTAFLFNFVPNIGSIIAAIPAILLALIQLGAGEALLLGIGYVVINVVVGNIIEPKLMGERLGLSTLVVFLSLMFWGWVWGPMGMLLSVPLTVIVQIVLDHYDDSRWLAVMLAGDPSPNETRAPSNAS